MNYPGECSGARGFVRSAVPSSPPADLPVPAMAVPASPPSSCQENWAAILKI